MNSDDLKLFALIVRAGSVSRAAIETGVDQSTVSRRIAALEKECGVRLFHRSGRGVVLTDRGRQLLDYATAVDKLLDEAGQALREGAAGGPERLHIAAQPTIAQMLFAPLGQALAQRFPATRLRFVDALASQILEWLADGELDVAIVYLPEHSGAIRHDPLFDEGVHLVTAPDFPLAQATAPVALLGEVPLLLPSTHHGLRALAEGLAARHGFALRPAPECDGSTAVVKRLVMHGCGCTLLPLAAVADEVAAGRLKSFRLIDPEVRRRVAIVQGRNRATPPGLWEALRLVRTTAAELVASGAWPDALPVDGEAASPPTSR